MKNKSERVIFMSDCQSFYASVEKASHPEYKDQPLAVCGDPARRSGIVLAACPKKNASGIFILDKDKLEDTLWPLSIDKMFMVGSRMTQHLIAMGINTIGDLARTPLFDLKRKMRVKFGKNSDINVELYWRIANGKTRRQWIMGIFTDDASEA